MIRLEDEPCEICREARRIREQVLKLKRRPRRNEGKIAKLEAEERRVMAAHPMCKTCTALMGPDHDSQDAGGGVCSACHAYHYRLERRRLARSG
jgi:phage shock protein A